MKNLTKILIAVALVALLLCSIVVVIGADNTVEYKGKIGILQSRYQNVVNAVDDKAADQAKILAETYDYIARNPVNPDEDPGVDDEGNPKLSYNEIITLMSAHSVRIGNLLFDEIDKIKGAETDKIVAINAVYDHIKACPTLDGEEGAAELAAKLEAKNAEVLIKYFDTTEALAQDKIAEKRTNLYAIYAQLELHPVDETVAENATFLNECSLLTYDVALAFYNSYTQIPTVCQGNVNTECSYCKQVIKAASCDHVDEDDDLLCDSCGKPYERAHYFERYNAALQLERFVALCDITAAEEYRTLKGNISAAVNDVSKEYEAKRNTLDEQANFDEYEYLDYYVYDTFDKDPTYKGIAESTMKELFKFHHTDANSYVEEKTDIYGNTYHNAHARGGVHNFIEPFYATGYTLGLVYDFDMLLSDDFEFSYFEAREQSVGIKKLFTLSGKTGEELSIVNNPERSDSGVKKTTVTGVIERGVWTHITLTYDNEERVGKLYVNYEYVMDIEYHNTWKFQGFRMNFGSNGTYSQEIGIDNFQFFQGPSYRIFDKFFSMNERQKFEYYVDYMLDGNKNSLGRNSAYNKAKSLVSQYRAPEGQEETDEYVIKFDSCNYNEDIKIPAMAENILILQEMVAELEKMEITSATIADLDNAIAKINEFVSANGELINKGDTSAGGYQDQMLIVYGVQADMVAVENVVAFVNAITKFHRATGYTMMTRYWDAARGIYEAAEFDLPENAAFLANDPVVLAFEKALNGEDVLPEDESYIDIFEYYASVPEKLLARAEKENSKRIIDCINFIVSLEGYEATKEFWDANSEYIAKYATVVRDIISSGAYDPTLEGVEESIAIFEELDFYFYKLLQQEHIEYITAQLDKYIGAESIIDKMGVCAVVREYIEASDIALYNTDMSEEMIESIDKELKKLESLVSRYYVYEGEIELQKEDYKNILERNTTYFINTIEQMDTVLTYSELVPLFEKATSYYYGIDVEEEATQAAIEKYVGYREKLESLEANGAIFIGYVNTLADANELTGREKQDAIYVALVNCMSYATLTDVGVEGVAEANEIYEAALAEYNAELGVVKTEISETAKVTCAVRSDCISTTVLAIIGKIFED
ncbi:MAG: hypothetical protein IJ515_03990 [Clostridia bacterium]|nr:hypothetical protein [Clostridia bacterium]